MQSVDGPTRALDAFGAIDVAGERGVTLGIEYAAHLNAAGSALPSIEVVESVVEHLRLEERIGGYEAAGQVRGSIEAVYDSAASVLGCHRDEIALLDSATTGLRVVMDALRIGRQHRMLVSRSTYVSHALHLMSLARETGAELILLENGPDGAVDLGALSDALASGRSSHDIVCVAHIPTSSGLVEPVQEIGRLARLHGAVFVLDATQSVGQVPVDVGSIGCDALATTGRKFLRAPRGTGLLYVRRGLLAELLPTAPDVRGAVWTSDRSWDLSTSARRFETFECSTAARLGLGVALEEFRRRGVGATANHLVAWGGRLRADLAALAGVVVRDPDASPSAIVTFTVDGVDAEVVKSRLAESDIRVVTVPATHGQWDLGVRALDSVVRASVHVYNDARDIARLVEGVAAIGERR